jgi:peptidoglycan-associated lipoprotein
MRVLFALLIPLIAACSTVTPRPSPSASIAQPTDAQPTGQDLTGRWRGTWTGTGIFHSTRVDAVRVDLVQRGDRGTGRLVLEGAIAAESVPEVVRFQGLNGIPLMAEVRPGTVTIHHPQDGRLFTADLKVDESGERMFGIVRGSRPAVGLLLTRAEPKTAPAMPAPAPTPPVQSSQEPEPAKETVVAMVPPPAEPAKEAEKDTRAERAGQEEFAAVPELTTIRFDFDKAVIRSDAADVLVGHAAWLKDHEDTAVMVEGHCDERGTAEYNVALGDRRAKAVKDYLSLYGVAPERISTVSYGKERPTCTAATEACREENRRAEFRVKSR